jgi:hypothetical protein
MVPREEIDLPFGIKVKGEGIAGMMVKQAGWLVAVACLVYAIAGPLARVEASISHLDTRNQAQHNEIRAELEALRYSMRSVASMDGRTIARVP